MTSQDLTGYTAASDDEGNGSWVLTPERRARQALLKRIVIGVVGSLALCTCLVFAHHLLTRASAADVPALPKASPPTNLESAALAPGSTSLPSSTLAPSPELTPTVAPAPQAGVHKSRPALRAKPQRTTSKSAVRSKSLTAKSSSVKKKSSTLRTASAR